MHWWETALQYGSGPVLAALIAASALLLQQRQTDRRERERREAERAERAVDRDREDDRATVDRDSALRERWRDERKQAYAALIDNLNWASDKFRDLNTDVMTFRFDITGARDHDARQRDLEALQASVREAQTRVAVVQLIGSKESRECASEALRKSIGLASLLWVSLRAQRRGGDGVSDEVLSDRQNDREAAVTAFLEAARLDLEVN